MAAGGSSFGATAAGNAATAGKEVPAKGAGKARIVMAADSTLWYEIVGRVTDATSGSRLPAVSVKAGKYGVGTVTNDDGDFLLKVKELPATLQFSCVGYDAATAVADSLNADWMRVSLKPGTLTLQEAVLYDGDPKNLLEEAMKKVPESFGTEPHLWRTFYRETTQKGRRYNFVAETVGDMYKTGYDKGTMRDRVTVLKGRRTVSPKADTLVAKLEGGPTIPVELDPLKDGTILLGREEMEKYSYSMLPPEHIGDRPQIVIRMEPASLDDPYALYHAKIYLDRSDLSFSRIEMSLDMRDQEKAERMVLVRRPAGLRFRLLAADFVINYDRQDDGHMNLGYFRSELRFRCDWKKRLFHSPYTIVSETVVTGKEEGGTEIPKENVFRRSDKIFDEVQNFGDDNFWGKYNVIKPTESLEHAIVKLIKMQ